MLSPFHNTCTPTFYQYVFSVECICHFLAKFSCLRLPKCLENVVNVITPKASHHTIGQFSYWQLGVVGHPNSIVLMLAVVQFRTCSVCTLELPWWKLSSHKSVDGHVPHAIVHCLQVEGGDGDVGPVAYAETRATTTEQTRDIGVRYEVCMYVDVYIAMCIVVIKNPSRNTVYCVLYIIVGTDYVILCVCNAYMHTHTRTYVHISGLLCMHAFVCAISPCSTSFMKPHSW